MSYSDDYDDGQELVELSAHESSVLAQMSDLSGHNADKAIRRRSSKACDQCRKSKCKCERASPGEPCRNCIMLGTTCTFLGPSRKRGPPKGYIDAIEARLHQTEALIGVMLAYNDDRVKSIFEDLSQDSFARKIIKRVNNSPYGVKGRKQGEFSGSKQKHPATAPLMPSDPADINSIHPSNEWQDKVVEMLRSNIATASSSSTTDPTTTSGPSSRGSSAFTKPVLRLSPSHLQPTLDPHDAAGSRRQRRKIGDLDAYPYSAPTSATYRSSRSPDSEVSPFRRGRLSAKSSSAKLSDVYRAQSLKASSTSSESDSDGDFAGAIGQLSLNEEEEVRYHGKASGLHLLDGDGRMDGRNEGGIWRFPKARVWPPLPSSVQSMSQKIDLDLHLQKLPSKAVQDYLISLYFTYAHPALPVVHKASFLEAYKSGSITVDNAHSPDSDNQSMKSGSPFTRRRRSVPVLLLFVMLSIGARFAGEGANLAPPSDRLSMWPAGDGYLDQAKLILDQCYSNSKPSTCQALILMGYREIGIGAMAQAWTYVGMAIRMAQDLGLHRSADLWSRVGLGGKLFSELELQERRRIWYACVVMDKYVSTYIGRPLGICDHDFDTDLPSENDVEESEYWLPHVSRPLADVDSHPKSEKPSQKPGRVISAFNASATLSSLLGEVVTNLYSPRSISSRHSARASLESQLDKWHIELPESLRLDTGVEVSPPHILTLHMQYWCAVLLLHRPFIRPLGAAKNKSPDSNEESRKEARATTARCNELCAGAANHITSIASVFMENFYMARSPAFLCYYLFTAGIMHVTTLSSHPTDPQASTGLTKCMDALSQIEITWPSASRALVLLRGSRKSAHEIPLTTSLSTSALVDRSKRTAQDYIDDVAGRGHVSPSGLLDPNESVTTDSLYSGLSLRDASAFSQPSYASDLYMPNPSSSVASHPSLDSVPSFYSPYTARWPGSTPAPGSPSYNGGNSLNSVVLSSMFSTGMVPDRGYSANTRTSSSQSTLEHRRYPSQPQYQWQEPTYYHQQPQTQTQSPSHAGAGSRQQQQQPSSHQLYNSVAEQFHNIRAPPYL